MTEPVIMDDPSMDVGNMDIPEPEPTKMELLKKYAVPLGAAAAVLLILVVVLIKRKRRKREWTMKFSDLLRMSINNLRRRKLRTGLTVLGVVIGTASDQ